MGASLYAVRNNTSTLDSKMVAAWVTPSRYDDVDQYQNWGDCCTYPGAYRSDPPPCQTAWIGFDCREATLQYLDDTFASVAVFVIVIGVLEFSGMIAMCTFMFNSKKEDKTLVDRFGTRL
jgi:hypothetical protein